MDKDDFENAMLGLDRPDPAATRGDVVGDMGLGRQLLLLKWLVEGSYINIPGYEFEGRSFSEILEKLKEPMDIDGDNESMSPLIYRDSKDMNGQCFRKP